MVITQYPELIPEPMGYEGREPLGDQRGGVYQIICKPTGKVYVGSTVHIRKRKWAHRRGLSKQGHCNPHLQRAWDQYGPDAFTHSVLEYCEKEKPIEREQYYIDELKAANPKYGFNICPTAYSNLGRKLSPEMRAKLSAASKGKPGTLSPIQIEELRERMKGNTFSIGIKHTPESCAKRWEARMAQASITPQQCIEIRDRYIPNVVSMRKLAVIYGCSAATILNVINKKYRVYQ